MSKVSSSIRSSEPAQIRRITWEDWNKSFCAFDVDIRVDHVRGSIVWGRHQLRMNGRMHMLRLVQCFLEAPGRRLDREGLVGRLYENLDFSGCTTRFIESKRHNAVKMISRTRPVMELAFARCGASAYRWFPYDKESQTWELMQLKRLTLQEAG